VFEGRVGWVTVMVCVLSRGVIEVAPLPFPEGGGGIVTKVSGALPEVKVVAVVATDARLGSCGTSKGAVAAYDQDSGTGVVETGGLGLTSGFAIARVVVDLALATKKFVRACIASWGTVCTVDEDNICPSVLEGFMFAGGSPPLAATSSGLSTWLRVRAALAPLPQCLLLLSPSSPCTGLLLSVETCRDGISPLFPPPLPQVVPEVVSVDVAVAMLQRIWLAKNSAKSAHPLLLNSALWMPLSSTPPRAVVARQPSRLHLGGRMLRVTSAFGCESRRMLAVCVVFVDCACARLTRGSSSLLLLKRGSDSILPVTPEDFCSFTLSMTLVFATLSVVYVVPLSEPVVLSRRRLAVPDGARTEVSAARACL
jgi:hypothetical protein